MQGISAVRSLMASVVVMCVGIGGMVATFHEPVVTTTDAMDHGVVQLSVGVVPHGSTMTVNDLFVDASSIPLETPLLLTPGTVRIRATSPAGEETLFHTSLGPGRWAVMIPYAGAASNEVRVIRLDRR